MESCFERTLQILNIKGLREKSNTDSYYDQETDPSKIACLIGLFANCEISRFHFAQQLKLSLNFKFLYPQAYIASTCINDNACRYTIPDNLACFQYCGVAIDQYCAFLILHVLRSIDIIKKKAAVISTFRVRH